MAVFGSVFGGGSVTGPGAISWTVRVQVGGIYQSGVDVWITTDQYGINVIAGTLQTDEDGSVTFMLDAGNRYVWCQKAGIEFSTNPTLITVS